MNKRGRKENRATKLKSQKSEHQMKEVRRKENLGPLLHICLPYCKEKCLVYNINTLIVILS